MLHKMLQGMLGDIDLRDLANKFEDTMRYTIQTVSEIDARMKRIEKALNIRNDEVTLIDGECENEPRKD